MAKEISFSDRELQALASLDWESLENIHGIKRSDIPDADLKNLANGKSSNLLSVNVEKVAVPGIPFTPGSEEKTVQLFTRVVKGEDDNWALEARIGVRNMDKEYKLSPENLTLVFDFGKQHRLDPEKDKAIISSLLETSSYTNAEGKKVSRHVCSICPTPLEMVWQSGEIQKFYVGLDDRSLRPVAISEKALKARLVDENGKSRIDHELFGKGITVSDELAQALSEGKVGAAFGKTQDGKEFATAISFNVARGEITEDHSSRGEQVRRAAFQYLRNNAGEKKTQEQKAEKSASQKPRGRKLV